VHNLTGTTAIARKPRQLTKRHDPTRLAVWTLADLDEALRTWAYDVYDTAEHPSLSQSQRAARLAGIERAGTRQTGAHDMTLEEFRLLAMPSTPKGTATVTRQGLQVTSTPSELTASLSMMTI
jgi:putative transposase